MATAGQNEIDMNLTLTRVADKLLQYKYVVKMVAKRHNKTATFMPKPIFETTGPACIAIRASGRAANHYSPAVSMQA